MSWLPRWKRKSKKDKELAVSEDRKESSPEAKDEAEPPVPLASGPYPTPLFTLTEHDEEESNMKIPVDSHTSEASSTAKLKVPTRRALRRPQPASFCSDGGYQSLTSRSTIADDLSDPFRERAMSGGSSVSSYYSPQGSVNFAPSPTSTRDSPPSFPEASKDEMMQAMKENFEKMNELVKHLESSIEELSQRVAKIEEILAVERRRPVSLPPVAELPNKTCKNDAILWLVEKVSYWKFLARRLGLENNEIARIETDNTQDRERCYQMFMRWKDVHAENYTYRVLGAALLKESQALYIEYVKEVCQLENIPHE
jgi:hypothetical protein